MTYVGPWLPEPVVEPGRRNRRPDLETAESVSMALLLVLESLSPVETGGLSAAAGLRLRLRS